MNKVCVVALGDYINALWILRSIPKNFFSVCIGKKGIRPCRLSRYCNKYIRETDDLIEILKKISEKYKGQKVLIPSDERYLLRILENKELLKSLNYNFLLPSKRCIETLISKKKLIELAKSLEIPVPRTYYDFLKIEKEINFPLYIKYTKSFVESKKMPRGIKVNSKEDLDIYLDSLPKKENIMIQEVLDTDPKNNYSLVSFYIDGKFLVSAVTHKVKQRPQEFGTGTIIEPIFDKRIKRILEKHVNKLFSALKYQGASETEFVYDKGEFKLIEVNPRFWMQHGVFKSLGVSFTEMYLNAALNNLDLSPTNVEEKNILWIDEFGAFLTFLHELVSRKLDIEEWTRILKSRKFFALFRVSDPLPFFGQYIYLNFLLLLRMKDCISSLITKKLS